jgi:hypothetical protein
MAFSKDGFNSNNKTKTYIYSGGSGEVIELHFCSNCRTGLFAFPKSFPELIILRANTLDDASQSNPSKSIYSDNAYHWDRVLK